MLSGQINNQSYYLIEANYYLTMGSRLFNFDGNAVTPKSIYYVKNNSLVNTDNYSDAIEKADSGKVYSISEFTSPIAIQATQHFTLVHSEGNDTTAVKLFEVIDN